MTISASISGAGTRGNAAGLGILFLQDGVRDVVAVADPILIRMGRRHPVAAIIKDVAARQGVFVQIVASRLILRDVLERSSTRRLCKEKVRLMQLEGQLVIDNESRELILVGHAFTNHRPKPADLSRIHQQ